MSVSGNDRGEHITYLTSKTQPTVCQPITLTYELQILPYSLIFSPPGLPIFGWNFYRVVLMYIVVASLVGVSTPSLLHPNFFMTLSFYSKRLSDLWTILGLALFSVSRPPSFLDQGTVIWYLTPGSEWLNGWFLAVSAVTGSVRDFVLLLRTGY